MEFIVKNLSEVFIGTRFPPKLLAKEGSAISLFSSNIVGYSIEIGEKQFINPKAARRIGQGGFIENGDFLFFIDKNNKPSIFQYNGELSYKVIPSNDIIVLKSYNTYLNNYLQLKRYQKKILDSIIRFSDIQDLKKKIENYSFNIEESSLSETELEVEDTAEEVIDEKAKSKLSASDISMTQKTLAIQNLITRIEEREINLDTKFQRAASLWDEDKKCKLIESILLSIPIPAFYFDASDEDNWLIIDGLQRLSTIREFVIDNTLILSDLDYLNKLGGKTWRELERKEQRRILEFEVVVYLVNKGTPKEVKYNIFKRINSGALTLKDQEIRHALNQGKPADTLIEFSKFREFKESIQLSDKRVERMEDRELVLRYLAFRITNYKKYNGNIKTFLDNTMEKINELSDKQIDNLATDFKHSLIICKELFGEHLFRRSIINNAEKNKRFSKVLYETWIYAVSNIDISKRQNLLKHRSKVISTFKGLMRGESVGEESKYEFDNLINLQSYSSERLKKRFEFIENLVNHWANDSKN